MTKKQKEKIMARFLEKNNLKIEYGQCSYWDNQPMAVTEEGKNIGFLVDVWAQNGTSGITDYTRLNEEKFFDLLEELEENLKEYKERIENQKEKFKEYLN